MMIDDDDDDDDDDDGSRSNHSSFPNIEHLCEIPTGSITPTDALNTGWVYEFRDFSTNIWLYVGNDTR